MLSRDRRSGCDHQIDRLGAFALLVRFDFEGDALTFGQVLQSSPLHRGDVNEHITPAIVGLDEAVAPFSVEELDRPSHGHRETPLPALLRRHGLAWRLDRTLTPEGEAIAAERPASAVRSVYLGPFTPPPPSAKAERKSQSHTV